MIFNTHKMFIHLGKNEKGQNYSSAKNHSIKHA